jgi:long-chain fatty acid transport protein
MTNHHFRHKRLALAIASAALSLGATPAFATGFQLNEQSASGLGNAFAAGAAFTDDISAMWLNPAALSKFQRRQVVFAGHLIKPSIEFNNDASASALNQPLGNSGGDAGGYNFGPNAYFSLPLNDQLFFGVGLNGAWGNSTKYDSGWIGRYQGLESEILTVNVNPALAWKVTPEVTLGVGVNFQYLDGKFTQNANYSGALAATAAAAAAAGKLPAAVVPQLIAATPGYDSKVTIKADDTAWGWNVGAAWDATPDLRLAASYRSKIKYNLSGDVSYDNPTITGLPAQLQPVVTSLSAAINSTALYNRGVTSKIEIPAFGNLSGLWRYGDRWEFMADAQWTQWSSISELAFSTTEGPGLPAVPLAWDDSWKFAVGTSYRHDEQWKLRGGIAYDQTPVTSHPTVRLPDSDRWWLAFGGEYKWTRDWKFDAGFAYIFASDATFDQNQGSTSTYGLVNGNYNSNVWILSGQVAYSF